jgi:hypothetical protein
MGDAWDLYTDFFDEGMRRLETRIKRESKQDKDHVASLHKEIAASEQKRDNLPSTPAYPREWSRLEFQVQLMQIALEEHEQEVRSHLVRAFVHVFTILDGFFGKWCELYKENPFKGQKLTPAATKESLQKLRCFKDLKRRNVISADTISNLKKLRAKRNVFVHGGGIADRKYCNAVNRKDLLGQPLEATQEDIDSSIEVATEIAQALTSEIEPPQ